MEKDLNISEIKPKNMFIPLTVIQAICVSVILITVLIIKLASSSGFKKLQKWCNNNILEPTYVTDVFGGENREA